MKTITTVSVAVLCACAVIAAVPTPGALAATDTAAGPTAAAATVVPNMTPSVSRDEWLQTSRRLAAPWRGLQRRHGSFRDVFSSDGSSRYGDAILGYGLIQTGDRDRNRRLVLSGIRAINAATRKVDAWFPTRGFEQWGVAAAYNIVHRKLRHLRAARAGLRRWARWLRRQRTTFLHLRGLQNKHVIDAVAVLEMRRTGLRSSVPGTILGGRRRYARRRAVDLITRRVPGQVFASTYVLSDPDTYPIAYHSISYAAYARAVRLLGRAGGRRPRAVLRELARTAWQVTAPDGEIAYWGRSMAHSWSLSALAYGLAATPSAAGSPWKARYRSVAYRVLRRLEAYGVGPRGEWTTPSLRQNFNLGRRTLDPYARSTEYTGLALVFLNLAIPSLPKQGQLGPIGSDQTSQAVVGQGTGRFAVVRQGNIWFAAREYGGLDLRYDFGLVAVKRLENGAWRDVVPLRPLGIGTGGPVLLTGGERGVPVGSSITASPDGTVTIRGIFRGRQDRALRKGVVFHVRPTSCGVGLSVDAAAGDLLEFSAFFRGTRAGGVAPSNVVQGPGQVATFAPPFQSGTFQAGHGSASDVPLSRGTFQVRTTAAGPAGITFC